MWGCAVVRRLAEAGHKVLVLEKRAGGGGNVRFEINGATQLIPPNLYLTTFPMSPNRRIFLNIISTHGRSLYALVCGLFCGRWTLMALGEYGEQKVICPWGLVPMDAPLDIG